MKFRFRLARLKRVRAIEERVAHAAWSGAEQIAREAEANAEQQRATVARGRTEAAGATDGPLAAKSAELDRAAVDHLLRVLVARREAALTTRGQADRLADAWRTRERDRRGLQELEERLHTRFRRESERAEARELDEIALARRFRREFDSSPGPGEADEGGSASPPRSR